MQEFIDLRSCILLLFPLVEKIRIFLICWNLPWNIYSSHGWLCNDYARLPLFQVLLQELKKYHGIESCPCRIPEVVRWPYPSPHQPLWNSDFSQRLQQDVRGFQCFKVLRVVLPLLTEVISKLLWEGVSFTTASPSPIRFPVEIHIFPVGNFFRICIFRKIMKLLDWTPILRLN